ncbi:MAG: calcium-binding protein, partial [Pseudomonadota bacterium]|nr:calcium-binding protein [Pseudomonadota bacterium]
EVEKEVKVKTEKTVIAKSKFDLMDMNNDGALTKAEASRSGVTKDFDKIDMNDDELISRVEYSKFKSISMTDSDE